MPRLSPVELRSRLALDYRATAGLSRETLGNVAAFASCADASRGRALAQSECEAGGALAYLVEFRFRHLVGRGVTSARAVAAFDLASGGNYPFSPPNVTFATRPVPWSPHVHPALGVVCLGDAWARSGGSMLLAQAVVHVMRLMNFDEPRTAFDGHWNASADAYWHGVLDRRPFLPDLRYPRLPAEVTHGLGWASAEFEPIEDGFRAAGSNEDEEADTFRPARSR